MVDVSIHAEKSFKDNFDYVNEVSGKCDSDLAREHFFVV